MKRSLVAFALLHASCGGDSGESSASHVDAGGMGGNAGVSSGGASGASGASGAGGSGLEGPPCVHDGREGVCVEQKLCVAAGVAPVPGLCAGSAEIQCCVALPLDGACDPAAHPLSNAGQVGEPGANGCPLGMLRVDAFCIDRYEAHLVTYPDGDPVSPYFAPGDPVMARSAKGAIPQGYISQIDASAACANAGKRLCTDVEWLRACQGPSGTTYPYGDTLQEGVCNDHRDEHPAIEYFMTSEDWIWSELTHPCLNQLDAGLAASGTFAGCESSEGAFDLMGNLHEWTADPLGTFRGGFYVDTALNGPGCLYATTAHDVNHSDYSTGFRCCSD